MKFDRFDFVITSKKARIVAGFLTLDGHQRYVIETINGELQIARESELARWETVSSFYLDEALPLDSELSFSTRTEASAISAKPK